MESSYFQNLSELQGVDGLIYSPLHAPPLLNGLHINGLQQPFNVRV
jgi:hypothetical protein